MSLLRRFFERPQSIGLRRALFQVHLWCGLAIGLYVVVISVSGSVLVYRDELRRAYDPKPRVVEIRGERLSEASLTAAAQRAYPGREVTLDYIPEEPSHAVTFLVGRGDSEDQILFDPYSGEALGHALPLGWRLTSWTLDLHDNLLSGDTGRRVNGTGAVLLVVMSGTGLILWWPGVSRWRRSLWVDWRAGSPSFSWKSFHWRLHSALGIWAWAFVCLWGVTGIYLCFPDPFSALVDSLEGVDPESFEPRTGDTVLYWLGYLHFGRFGGTPTKLAWALFGLAPPTLFATGASMWWNRVVRPRQRSGEDR